MGQKITSNIVILDSGILWPISCSFQQLQAKNMTLDQIVYFVINLQEISRKQGPCHFCSSMTARLLGEFMFFIPHTHIIKHVIGKYDQH